MENRSDESLVLLLERSKRGALKVIFGRSGIITLLLLLQIGFVFGAYYFLTDSIPSLLVLNTIGAAIITVCIINDEGNPSVKLTWIVLVLVMPVFGLLLYLYNKTDLGHRLLLKALNRTMAETSQFIPRQEELMDSLRSSNHGLHNLALYTYDHGGYPLFTNTDLKYFSCGEAAFDEMLVQLEKAERFIFLEFFIVDEGYMWGRILEILERKAKEGVEVRLMYDGTCAIFRLPYSYPNKLKALGIHCKMFSPIYPFVSTSYNNRDHRKILVIDGRVAFTGGVNLADEYINRKRIYGHWKDTAIMLSGEGVRSFTLMFLQMWNLDTKGDDYQKFLRHSVSVPASGYVIPYGDSPLDRDQVGKLVYMDIINRSKRYVHIMSPYLVLDNEMLTALCFAAERGVDVKLLLPHIPDKKLPFALAHSHYPRLMSSGVKIYEYTPGFVHAKTFVSDDVKAVVGTINLDYRSLYYHFECATYIYGHPAVADIEADFESTVSESCLMTPDDIKHDKLSRKLTGALFKIISPLV